MEETNRYSLKDIKDYNFDELICNNCGCACSEFEFIKYNGVCCVCDLELNKMEASK